MFGADNIRDWRDHHVVDPDGNKIGQPQAIYVDTAIDVPVSASGEDRDDRTAPADLCAAGPGHRGARG